MEDKIKSLIQSDASDLSLSLQEAVKNLLLQFEHQELFNIASNYLNVPSIKRREWIICIELLCQIDSIAANKRFVEALQVDDADKRFRIIKLLGGKCGTEYIVPTLITMLKEDPDPGIRFIVATTLGDIGDERALSSLRWSVENDHETNHEDTPVSYEAQKAIEHIEAKLS